MFYGISKRISKFSRMEIIEIPEEKLSEKASQKNILDCLEKEEEKIKSKVNPSSFVIELSLEGSELTSEEFSSMIEKITVDGYSSITFIIGSSHGLGKGIKDIANYRLKISKMTFPHQLARVILLEQIYRGFKILNGEPYHK